MSASNIFKKHFTLKNLLSIFCDRVISSSAIGIDRVRPAALEVNIKEEVSIIKRKVSNGVYRFTPYKEKLISKGATSLPRQISIPTARDRITLRALCDFLNELFSSSKMELPQTIIDSLKKALDSEKYTHYIKIDLKNFYPSLPHELVEAELKRKIRKSEIIKIILAAISTPTVNASKGGRDAQLNKVGVPQGLAISNILAEISLNDFDKKINGITDIWYKRYVDDILILCSSVSVKPETLADEIIERLTKAGLNPHKIDDLNSKSKVDSLANPFVYLGYAVSDRKIQIKKENIHKFESSIAKILTQYKHATNEESTIADKRRAEEYCRWRLNLRISGCVIKGSRRGWMAYFSQVSDTAQLHHINKTINKMIDRFDLKEKITPKSLIKTYYEIQRKDKSSSTYIPNFDNMSTKTKKEILRLWFTQEYINKLSDDEVTKVFNKKISREVDELEKDITSMS